jgi:hypothetical protein
MHFQMGRPQYPKPGLASLAVQAPFNNKQENQCSPRPQPLVERDA